MSRTAIKKTISLPPELARDAEEIARAEGKTLSAVIQDALRVTRAARLKRELRAVQDYWSRKAKEKGVLRKEDLRRYLQE
jgi:hypothetical protein